MDNLSVTAESFISSPEVPLGRGNNDDRRQWRKQGVIVGAAASKTRAKRRGCWEPQPGFGERSETERLFLFCLFQRQDLQAEILALDVEVGVGAGVACSQ